MCTRSLRPARTPRMSSSTETARIGRPPAISPSDSSRGSNTPNHHEAAAHTAAIAPTTARPPRRGVGSACVFRRPGTSIAPTSTARRAVSGVSANATAAAASAARMSEVYPFSMVSG